MFGQNVPLAGGGRPRERRGSAARQAPSSGARPRPGRTERPRPGADARQVPSKTTAHARNAPATPAARAPAGRAAAGAEREPRMQSAGRGAHAVVRCRWLCPRTWASPSRRPRVEGHAREHARTGVWYRTRPSPCADGGRSHGAGRLRDLPAVIRERVAEARPGPRPPLPPALPAAPGRVLGAEPGPVG